MLNIHLYPPRLNSGFRGVPHLATPREIFLPPLHLLPRLAEVISSGCDGWPDLDSNYISTGRLFSGYEDEEFVQFIYQSVKDFFMEKGLLALDNSLLSIGVTIGLAHLQLSRTEDIN